MFEAFELLGMFLREVCEIPGEKQVTVFQERAVNDPSDKELCPEAFKPRKTLEHIIGHLPIYSPIIGVGLKDTTERVLEEISKDWLAKDLNWDSAIPSMTIVEDFMEQVTSGLDSNGSPELKESLQEYIEKMHMKINIANYVKELSF